VSAPRSFTEDHYDNQKTYLKQRRLQTNIAFYVTLSLTVLGTLITFSGVTLLIFRNPTGLSTAAFGSINSLITGVLFVFNNSTNRRLKEAEQELASLASYLDIVNQGHDFVGKIVSQTEKDKLLLDLSRSSFQSTLPKTPTLKKSPNKR
jgi:hypothetical protein